MTAGAPSKYREAYCQEMIDHCATGASITSFAADIGVARSTIQEWESVHPEFSVAVKKAKAKCASWWESVARKTAVEGGGNATLCIFGLKNMGAEDWRDKTETEHSGGQTIQVVTGVPRGD